MRAGKKKNEVTIKGWTWAIILAAVGLAAFGLGDIGSISIELKPLF